MRFSVQRLRRAVRWVLLSGVVGAGASAQSHAPTYPPITAETDPANLAGERVQAPALADDLPIDHGAAALQQLLLKLRTRASLMLIVAHPDDEDGGLLTYESRGEGARVATLTLTRGEGGQNLMSADFDDALGLIRTQELLAADRFMGVDQMFGTVVDFGFSKTREETLRKWGHDRVLYDAVRAVRLYRPLVIASVFVGGPTDGHGHHQVAGEIAQEVFLAAGDPKVFPEMGLAPWQPLKVYARLPFSPVTAAGMFDYATGRTLPTRFHNYVTGADTHTAPVATVTIPEGEGATVSFPGHASAPTLGMDGDTYVQFARRGLALQKSQIGPNVRLAPPGAYDVGYTLMGARVTGCPPAVCIGKDGPGGPDPRTLSLPEHESGIFQNIEISLPGMISLAPGITPKGHAILSEQLAGMLREIEQAQKLFNPADVSVAAPPLARALRICDLLIAQIQRKDDWHLSSQGRLSLLHELRVKRVQLNDALCFAYSLRLEALRSGDASEIVRGQPLEVTVQLSAPATPPIAIRETKLLFTGLMNEDVAAPVHTYGAYGSEKRSSFRFSFSVPTSLPDTEPYFSKRSTEQAVYELTTPALRNAPRTPAPLTAAAVVEVGGVTLVLAANVGANVFAAGKLNARASSPPEPPAGLSVVPALSLAVSPKVAILTPERQTLTLGASLTAARATKGISLEAHAPQGWTVEPPSAQLPAGEAGARPPVDFHLTPGRSAPSALFTLSANDGAGEVRKGFRSVGYPGIPRTNLYTPATASVLTVDAKTAPGLRVAYVVGTGDLLARQLPALGVNPTILSPADLTPARLAGFDALVLGVRAFNAHPDLDSTALLDFARKGGVVIAQYNTGQFPAGALPYPLSVPGDPAHNVVVEENPVTLVEPDAPVLTWPNKITAHDFDGWIEERGHGFAASFDGHWDAPLEMHDPDQDPQRGGLLVAPVGKGAYIYSPLAFYRQLPEGVPGAYRLMANLLSYAKNPRR